MKIMNNNYELEWLFLILNRLHTDTPTSTCSIDIQGRNKTLFPQILC